MKNRWYAVLSKRLPNNTPTSVVENEHSMNIGVKRKIEKAYDEMPNTEDSPKYNEEECESFIKGKMIFDSHLSHVLFLMLTFRSS